MYASIVRQAERLDVVLSPDGCPARYSWVSGASISGSEWASPRRPCRNGQDLDQRPRFHVCCNLQLRHTFALHGSQPHMVS